jgi:hypothetical protein
MPAKANALPIPFREKIQAQEGQVCQLTFLLIAAAHHDVERKTN